MPSERVQRQIDRLLDEADEAIANSNWTRVRDRAEAALRLDPDNADARTYLTAAGSHSDGAQESAPHSDIPSTPASVAQGRYRVRELLGEGGKKRVYRADDTLLDREIALALIKTAGLDAAGRERIRREARAMGRLGSHPNIVSVLDLGEERGQPYLVTELMPGGALTTVIEQAPDHRLPIERAIDIGRQICAALEHAHSRDVIHRDLKPGNVWLTEAGTAKLGDFGLAVALDQTRQTQPGLMVGTVSYMAPEQATGGEVGARADLYALGCLLYELTCGRPPFVGDDSVAIIGQHLNTPPVAPAWHRPDCPPGLDALILNLLEKDPARRPDSATSILAMLGSIAASPMEREPVAESTQPSGDDPLYRRTFVGREHEIQQLHAAVDAALSGNGSLVMVVGEPGIGKTAVCEQLATYVALRGGKTLVGHCYEEGSLSLPYLAFVEAMRSYVLARDPDGLKDDLGSGASDVARIVSEIRDRVDVEIRPAGDPEDDRWRLLQAVTGFLRSASSVQPLLLVLEDLHWADRGTLDLLIHLARNLHTDDATGRRARLLIVGTYRDVEVDRAHPLSGALAELRRNQSFLRIPLRGLTVDEVHRMYQAIRGQEIAWAQAEAVHRQTEGNPLFVQEVLRYLVEEGLVVREGGRWVPQQGVGAGIPEGLRDVVGKRLSRLSPECNRLLAVAAVIGRDFDLETLRGVAGLSEDELLAGIEEAVRVGVLEERSLPGAVRYRFAHAYFRQSLYEEMIAPRRLRLHQEVARVLEAQYASRKEEHAAELAEHYGHSTDRDDLRKAVEYSELAARRAMGVFAYSEAEAHLRRCLEVQEVLDPDDAERRCDLLLALGDAMLPQDDPKRVIAMVAPEAFRLAEALGQSDRAARGAIQAIESLIRSTGAAVWVFRESEFQDWAGRADQDARAGTVQRVYADIYQGLARLGAGQPRAAHVFMRRAVEGAFALNENSVVFSAAGWAFRNLSALRDRHTLRELAQEVLRRPRRGVRASDLGHCLYYGGKELLCNGQRAEAELLWQELSKLTDDTHESGLRVLSLSAAAYLAFIDGLLEEAVNLFELSATTGQRLGVGIFPPHEVSAPALLYLGRETDALLAELLDFYGQRIGGRQSLALGARILALQGRYAEARAKRDQFGDIGSEHDETSMGFLLCLFEAAIVSEDHETLEALLPRFAPLADTLWIGRVGGLNASVGRVVGEAAALLGRYQESRNFYTQALDACSRIRFRPEIAITRLRLAELVIDHRPGERPEALEHLDFAIGEFRDMKMQPSLERALRRKLELQGVGNVSPSTSIDAVSAAVAREAPDLRSHAAPDGTVTLLFTDIEGSTDLTIRLGDERWLEFLRSHHELVRKQVHRFGGFEVKSQGDGFMLAFQSARRALDCAIAIQRAVAAEQSDPPIRVRMGLHTGEAMRDAGDFHGRDVVLAARIADRAQGGEILVSELLQGLVGSQIGVELRDAGRRQLKGLPGRQRLFQVVWT
jgi:class 3 adenylate cyclase